MAHDPRLGTPEEGRLAYGDGPIRFGPHHVEITFMVPDLPPGRHQLTQANAAGISIGDLTMGLFWIDRTRAPLAELHRLTWPCRRHSA